MRIVICCLVLTFGASLFASELIGQEKPANRDGDFELTFQIGLGLPGVKTGASYGLKDSHDVYYDTMALLNNPNVRQEVGLDEDSYRELWDARSEAVSEIDKLTMAAALDEEERARMKVIYMNAEQELKSQFTDAQLSTLRLARAQVGIEKVGLQYLEIPQMAKLFGISPEAAKLLGENGEQVFLELKKEILALRKEANKQLIKQLSETDRSKLENLISDKTAASMMASRLFLKGRVEKKKIIKLGPKLVLMLRSKLIQKKLVLSDAQIDQLQNLKGRDENAIKKARDVLAADQWKTLLQLAIEEALKKSGTVNLISTGIVAELLELSEENAKSLFEAGKRINKEMVSKLEQICQTRLRGQFSVSDEATASISKLMARAIQKSR